MEQQHFPPLLLFCFGKIGELSAHGALLFSFVCSLVLARLVPSCFCFALFGKGGYRCSLSSLVLRTLLPGSWERLPAALVKVGDVLLQIVLVTGPWSLLGVAGSITPCIPSIPHESDRDSEACGSLVVTILGVIFFFWTRMIGLFN